MSLQTLERHAVRRAPRTLHDCLAESSAVSTIAAHGFVELPWNPAWVASQAGRARESFWNLLASPERDLFAYRKATEADDQGLFDRNGEAKKELSLREAAEKSTAYDNKWFFHCYPWTREALQDQGAPVEKFAGLFNACEHFNHAAMRLALALGHGLDEINETAPQRHYPGRLVDRFTRSKVVTRLLRYKSKAADAPLGKVHRDRCGITVHWYSSHPGLRVFEADKRPVLVHDDDPGRVLAFLSENAWAATRGLFGTGVLHGASNLVHGVGSEDERFVAVTFVHCKLDEADLQWKESHRNELEINPADYPL
jgi:hypothetical protein